MRAYIGKDIGSYGELGRQIGDFLSEHGEVFDSTTAYNALDIALIQHYLGQISYEPKKPEDYYDHLNELQDGMCVEAVENGFQYAEGLVDGTYPDAWYLLHGKVVDITRQDREEHVYVGVVVPLPVLSHFIVSTEGGPVLQYPEYHLCCLVHKGDFKNLYGELAGRR